VERKYNVFLERLDLHFVSVSVKIELRKVVLRKLNFLKRG